MIDEKYFDYDPEEFDDDFENEYSYADPYYDEDD